MTGPAPLEQGGHGQPAGLAGLGRARPPGRSAGPRWPAALRVPASPASAPSTSRDRPGRRRRAGPAGPCRCPAGPTQPGCDGRQGRRGRRPAPPPVPAAPARAARRARWGLGAAPGRRPAEIGHRRTAGVSSGRSRLPPARPSRSNRRAGVPAAPGRAAGRQSDAGHAWPRVTGHGEGRRATMRGTADAGPCGHRPTPASRPARRTPTPSPTTQDRSGDGSRGRVRTIPDALPSGSGRSRPPTCRRAWPRRCRPARPPSGRPDARPGTTDCHLPQGHAPGQPGHQSRSVPVRRSSCRLASASEGAWPKTTRVSVSASRPSASRCWAEPAAPAACRSDSRCTTATLATPTRRASLNVACSQRAVARSCSTAQASSTTTSRFAVPVGRPGSPAASRSRRSSAAASAGEANTADRSSTTTEASRRRPAEVGPSNMPARSPSTSRRSSRATRRPSWASPAASVRTVGRQHRVRVEQGRDQIRAAWVRRHAAGHGRARPARPRCAPAAMSVRPSDDAASEQASSARRRRAPAGVGSRVGSRGPSAAADAGADLLRPGARSSGLSRTAPPGARRSGVLPHASARGPYSPLGSTIQACRPERHLPPDEGLDERRLARARPGPGRSGSGSSARPGGTDPTGRSRTTRPAGPGRSAGPGCPRPPSATKG